MLKLRDAPSALTAAPLTSVLVVNGVQLIKSVEASTTTMPPSEPAICNWNSLLAGSSADFVTGGAGIATNCTDWMVNGASFVAATVTMIKSEEAAVLRSSVATAIKV